MYIGDFLNNINTFIGLVDASGNSISKSACMKSWHKLVFAGAGTQYAYFNLKLDASGNIIPNGDIFKQSNIRVLSTNSTTLTIALEMNIKDEAADSNNWQPVPPYDATFVAAEAQKVNTVYQQVEAIYSTPCRVAITVTNSTTVFLQITTGL